MPNCLIPKGALLLAGLFLSFGCFSQTTVTNNNANIRVESGTYLNVDGNYLTNIGEIADHAEKVSHRAQIIAAS